MITSTSLRHPSLRCRLHGAMITAAKHSRTTQVIGHAFVRSLCVSHVRDVDALPIQMGYASGFTFEDNEGNDVTTTVLNELRQPMPSNKATYDLGTYQDTFFNQHGVKAESVEFDWEDVIYAR